MSLTTDPAEAAHPPKRPVMPRLGEELPIFCERCGYSLHGLPQSVCEQCTIRQFHCPECGHHQPINTLRPAVQKILGRVLSLAMIASVVLRLGFFGLMMLAWFAMGNEWIYRYNEFSAHNSGGTYEEVAPQYLPLQFRDVDTERLLAFAIFAFAFGCVARMLLLRWRRGHWVGAAIAGLVMSAILLGASARYWDSLDRPFPLALPYRGGLFFLLAYTGAIIVFAASVVWPIWCGLVKVFLPKRAAGVLLDWQRSMSDPHASPHIRSALSRESIPRETASVAALP
ncbi:MAG: hypothetical protein H7Z14_05830 [Anaerolineae bacterium]|nr:hypothetical protein [Phycisphaerae bacterium]